MRAEEQVNEHRTAFKHYRGSNGAHIGLPQTLHPSWWQRFKIRHSLRWENLIVGGREVKGFIIPQWAAGVLLAAVIGVFGFFYVQNRDQRDSLVRLETKLDERSARDAEYRHDTKNQLDLQQVYINNLDKQLTVMKLLLSPAQQKMLRSKQEDN